MSDEEFQSNLQEIEEGKLNFSEDEQSIIDAWIAKLSEPKETEEENEIRNEYARTLARLTTQEKQLLPPFTDMPDIGDLPPLSSPSTTQKKPSFPAWRMPCSNTTPRRQSTSPKPKRREIQLPMITDDDNEFEDIEEMARVIAQSKGQTLSDFIMGVSRYTVDSGHGLRNAMRSETTYFKEYVDRVMAQRVKDLAQLLDEEHNMELQKIKKDIDKWELELTHCKKRIKEMIPEFDLEMYKKDKKYLKKVFTVETPGSVRIDALHRYVEDLAVATQLYMSHGAKAAKCNEVATRKIEDLKEKITALEGTETVRQQTHLQEMRGEIGEYQRLKDERDMLHREIMEILAQLHEKQS